DRGCHAETDGGRARARVGAGVGCSAVAPAHLHKARPFTRPAPSQGLWVQPSPARRIFPSPELFHWPPPPRAPPFCRHWASIVSILARSLRNSSSRLGLAGSGSSSRK